MPRTIDQILEDYKIVTEQEDLITEKKKNLKEEIATVFDETQEIVKTPFGSCSWRKTKVYDFPQSYLDTVKQFKKTTKALEETYITDGTAKFSGEKLTLVISLND